MLDTSPLCLAFKVNINIRREIEKSHKNPVGKCPLQQIDKTNNQKKTKHTVHYTIKNRTTY